MPCNSRPRSKHRDRKKVRKNAKLRSTKAAQEDFVPRGPSLGEVIESVIPRFIQFYTLSGLDLSDRDWFQMIRSLRNNLPPSFRLRSDQAVSLPPALASLTRYVSAVDAYTLAVDAKALRLDHPEVNTWLIDGTQKNTLSRQEIVSMLPVSLLFSRRSSREISGFSVLDLCASPGSKTSQAAEKAGLVVANELSHSRSHTLAKRARKDNVVVVNHKAQTVPDVGYRFDCVVCDVPCSGDGTFRKYPDKWGKWEPSVGRQLHSLQVQIAMRGARLLKVGGLMAYSTCSVNPLENEAVVQAVLARTDGALVVVKKEVKDFVTRPGVAQWAVVNEDFSVEAPLDAPTSARVRASMFPTGKFDEQLKNCVRVYPHDNDTGGFFIAVLKKVRDWPAEDGQTKPEQRGTYAVDGCELVYSTGGQKFRLNERLAEFMSGPGRCFNVVSAGVASV